MNDTQFNAFLTTFQANMQNLTAAIPASAPVNALNIPKISVKISTFRGAPKKNVML